MTAFGKSRHSLNQTNFCTNSQISQAGMTSFAAHPQAMLTEIYIEALLVDEELADQVWAAWDKGAKDNVLSTKIEFVIL